MLQRENDRLQAEIRGGDDVIDDNGADLLIYAIIMQAVEDYGTALLALKKMRDKGCDRTTKKYLNRYRVARECERFFRSEWGKQICLNAGEEIIRRIRSEVDAGTWEKPRRERVGKNRVTRKDRKVRCIETGQIFSNATEVALVFNRKRGTITHHLNGHQGAVAKLHFEWADDEKEDG